LEADQKTREHDERLFFGRVPANALGLPAYHDETLPTSAGARKAFLRPTTISTFARQTRAVVLADFDEELARGAAFLLMPVFMAVGALTYFGVSEEISFRPIVLGAAVLSILLYLARSRIVLKLGLASALLLVVGMFAGKVEAWRTGTKMLGSPVTTRVSGVVKAIEFRDGGRVRLTVDVQSTMRPKLRYQPDRIRVSAKKIPSNMRPGSGIAGLVRLFPARGPLTPGGYDFAFENYFDGIGANGFFLGTPKIGPRQQVAGFTVLADEAIQNFRLDVYERITATLRGETGEIAAALVTGLKGGISDTTNDALRRTGLAHILSISGLHMALAAGTIMGMLRFVFALFPGFASRYPVKKFSAATAIAAGFAYLLLSGGGVATQRSFIMLAVMLLALLHDHAAITMRNLAIAAVIMIAISPHDVAGPSFQMSFAATAALVAAYGAWTDFRFKRCMARDGRRIPTVIVFLTYPLRHVGGLALTSIVAGSATAIFAAYHFHRIAPLGLPANLAALPLFSMLVMPSAVLAMVLMPFDLEVPALQVMGHGIDAVTRIASWFARHTAGDITGLVPANALACLALALVILVIATTRWRLAAIPFVMAASVFLWDRRLPDIMVSEDGGLVAVRTSDGNLAVNRMRPNDFVIGDWEKTSLAKGWLPPEEASRLNQAAFDKRFVCVDGLCVARSAKNVNVAIVSDKERLQDACAMASIVIVSDPTVKSACHGLSKTVITAQRLALRGTAFVYVQGNPSSKAQAPPFVFPQLPVLAGGQASAIPNIVVQQAIASNDRPWNHVRIYLRHARGLQELD
jgi:ComEC/Rec2-related protein